MLYILVEAIYSYREQDRGSWKLRGVDRTPHPVLCMTEIIINGQGLEFFRALIFLFDSVTSHDQMSMNARG